MWCKSCQQDVPCLPADSSGQFHCPRCGEIAVDRMALEPRGVWASLDRPMSHYTVSPAEALPPPPLGSTVSPWLPSPALQSPWLPTSHTSSSQPAISPTSSSLPSSAEPPPVIQDWAVEAALDRIGRMLSATSAPADESTVMRVDAPHALAAKPSSKASAAPRIGLASPERGASRRPDSGGSVLAWVAMMFGTTAGACGAVLLLWSTVALRPELWQLGMPIAMVGAGLLLIGVFLQLDHLRMQNRNAAGRTAARRSAASRSPASSRHRRMSS